MNDYIDLSFMEVDEEYYSKNEEGFSAKILLKCDLSNRKDDSLREIICNKPISYNEGIFRVKSVIFEEGVLLKVGILGKFSDKDPNGHTLNGWTNDEISNSCTKEFTSVVGSLEI